MARAEEVLSELEAAPSDTMALVAAQTGAPPSARAEPSVVYDLAQVSIDEMTPIEALNELARLRAAALNHLRANTSDTNGSTR